MKEIVIRTNKSEAHNTLLTTIKTLFPECKISIVRVDNKEPEYLNMSSSVLSADLPVNKK